MVGHELCFENVGKSKSAYKERSEKVTPECDYHLPAHLDRSNWMRGPAAAILPAFRGGVNILRGLPLPTNAGQHNPIVKSKELSETPENKKGTGIKTACPFSISEKLVQTGDAGRSPPAA